MGKCRELAPRRTRYPSSTRSNQSWSVSSAIMGAAAVEDVVRLDGEIGQMRLPLRGLGITTLSEIDPN